MSSRFTLLIVSLALIVSARPGSGASRSTYETDPVGSPSGWIHLGTQSGLPSTRVLALAEDNDGTLWVMTQAGAATFDSYRWQPTALSISVGTDSQPYFLRTAEGDLLLAAMGFVFRCEDGELHKLDLWPEWPERRCMDIAAAPGGGWIALHIDPGAKVAATLYSSAGPLPIELPDSSVENIRGSRCLVDGGEAGPVLFTGTGIYRYADGRWSQIAETERSWRISAGACAREGSVVIDVLYPYTQAGVWQIENGRMKRFESTIRQSTASLVCSEEHGVLALRSTGQLLQLDQGVWRQYIAPPGELDQATCATVRSDGAIVIGTFDGVFFRSTGMALWTRNLTGDLRDRVADLCRAKDGSLWIATADGLGRQASLDGPIEWTHEVLGIQLRGLTGVAEDSNGGVWISAGGSMVGALRWDGHEWRYFGEEKGLPTPVHRMELDRAGRLWFLCLPYLDPGYLADGPGAIIWDGSGFERFSPGQPLPSSRLYSFAHGPDGSYWFGHGEGLSRWKQGEFEHWFAGSGSRGLGRARVFTLAVEQSGKVWFAHQVGGLGYLEEDGTVAYLDRSDGIIGEDIWELKLDERGQLWASTLDGLLLHRDGQLIPLDRSTGLHTHALWPVLPERDRVTVGSIGRGIGVLHLDTIGLSPPKLVIDGPHRAGNRFELRWRAFAKDATRSPASIETRRRLDDEEWSRWGLQRNWASRPLQAGTHTIEVEARGLLGQSAVEHLTVSIPSALWRRPVVFLPVLGLCLVLGIGLCLQQGRKRRLHAQVRASEERYRDLVENAGLPIYTHDLEGRLIDLNRSAEEVFGLTRELARGRELDGFVAESAREGLRGHLSSVISGKGAQDVYEVTFLSSSGARRIFEVHTRLIRRDEQVQGLQSVALEVTRRKSLESELDQIRKMEAIGQLAGGIAHDFNNVLLVVNGHCELLLEDLPHSSPLEPSVRAILQAGERAASLTRELLAYGRKQVMNPECIDLNGLLKEMAQTLLRLLGEDIRLEMDLCDETATVRADLGQLQQVILNLGVNARDAMALGGELKVRTSIQNGGGSNSGAIDERTGDVHWVVLTFKDSGHGMDAATLRRIFEPFFTTKRPGKGTGLGLASVQGIVQQSGGYIRVDSEPGNGTTFRVFLRAEQSGRPVGTERPIMVPRKERSGVSILLVEDEDQVRHLMSRTLRDAGFDVHEASDGKVALEMARSSELSHDIVVSDVVMPIMSGPELVRQLETLGSRAGVIFVSGYSGDELKRYGITEGTYHLLQKPFRREQLLEIVHALLDSRRRAQPRSLGSRR